MLTDILKMIKFSIFHLFFTLSHTLRFGYFSAQKCRIAMKKTVATDTNHPQHSFLGRNHVRIQLVMFCTINNGYCTDFCILYTHITMVGDNSWPQVKNSRKQPTASHTSSYDAMEQIWEVSSNYTAAQAFCGALNASLITSFSLKYASNWRTSLKYLCF